MPQDLCDLALRVFLRTAVIQDLHHHLGAGDGTVCVILVHKHIAGQLGQIGNHKPVILLRPFKGAHQSGNASGKDP